MKYIAYKEKKTHGTFDFPIEFYSVSPTHPRYEMSYHWHIEHEIIRVLQGELHVTVDEKNLIAKSGDVIFLHGGALHGGMPYDCIYECVVFHMQSLIKHESICKAQLQKIMNQSYAIYNYFPYKNDKFHDLVNNLCDNLCKKSFGYEFNVLGSLYQILGTIIEYHYYDILPDSTNHNNKRILQLKNAIELIETSYGSCISLNDLATAANMNAKYFCRFFNEMTHRTPIDYLNYYRIECACLQLATTDFSITDIALNCGFNDTSYFIKTFKKYKGVTPKKYLSMPL
ncbi:AraC family transcriptional regulator [Lachnospiraceae bacterium LCP25S3_G4]